MEITVALPKLFGQRKKNKTASGPQPAGGATANLADMFQQSARGESGLKLPRFSTNAVDQPDRRDDRLAGIRMKVRGAYTPSQPVFDPRMFAGRVSVLKSAIRAIEDQRLHLVIYGERGLGKTSLLHMLTSAARNARYIVVYLSCGAASNFDETFRAVANEIPLLFHSDYAPTTAEAETGSSVASLLPAGRITPRQFGDLCSKLTGTRVIIVLDEFDRATNSQFRRDVAELLKILSDRSVRVQVVVAGVAADLQELVEHIPSVRRNILAIQVPLMSDEEIEELVRNGERSSGISVKPDAVSIIVNLACGSPYIASLISHHAALDALDHGRVEMIPADVISALDQALSELTTRIPRATLDSVSKLLTESSNEPLGALAAAALGGGSNGEFDLATLERLNGAAKAAGYLAFAAQLASREVLVSEGGSPSRKRYTFTEDAVPSYIWFWNAQRQLKSTVRVETASAARSKATL